MEMVTGVADFFPNRITQLESDPPQKKELDQSIGHTHPHSQVETALAPLREDLRFRMGNTRAERKWRGLQTWWILPATTHPPQITYRIARSSDCVAT